MTPSHKNLLDALKLYNNLITRMEVWNGSKGEYCIIKYNWPRSSSEFIFYTKSLGNNQIVLKEQGTNSNLFRKLLDYCYEFKTFDLEVRNEILPHPKYTDRKISGQAPRLIIKGWRITGHPIRNKHFAVTKFTYTNDLLVVREY